MPDKLHHAGSGDTGNQGVQTVYWFHCPGCEFGERVKPAKTRAQEQYRAIELLRAEKEK